MQEYNRLVYTIKRNWYRTDNPTPVNMLNENDIEIANIIDKYIFLNNESKKEFINFLDYLVYKNGISH